MFFYHFRQENTKNSILYNIGSFELVLLNVWTFNDFVKLVMHALRQFTEGLFRKVSYSSNRHLQFHIINTMFSYLCF